MWRSKSARIRRVITPYGWLAPIDAYRRSGGDRLLIVGLGLNSSDTVVDFGGYLGDWSAAVVETYGCKAIVFEPVPEFAERIRSRFASLDAVEVVQAAVGLGQGPKRLGIHSDSTSTYLSGPSVTVESASEEDLRSVLPVTIAVASINIEGGEYGFLPQLAESGLIDRFEKIFVQFHRVAPSSDRDRASCHNLLEMTHRQVWNYDYVWECWVRRTEQGITRSADIDGQT